MQTQELLAPYRQQISLLPPEAKECLRTYFRAPPGPLYPHLAGRDQATIVFVLLSWGTQPCRKAVETLIGGRIKRCLPHVPPEPAPVRSKPRTGDDRRITWVARPNPRAWGTPARDRYSLFRQHRSLAEFLARGGTRRDIREALQNGWIKVEGEK